MPDDLTKRGARDRARVAASERYEVDHLMRSKNITRERALELIAKHGGIRSRIDAELASER